jgi:hypothetical protein
MTGVSMHYVPEVKCVEQVMGPEEVVAMDEFTKLVRCSLAPDKCV